MPGSAADRRIVGLDALRAGAIAAVLVMHVVNHEYTARHEAQPGWTGALGYFGVELFFVLSGFLIGRILIDLAESRPNPRDWGVFLVRRWMRTLPVYYLWLTVLLIAVPPAAVVATALHYATFTQNLAWPMGDWFPVSWSLAVEEWFYLLFSLALAFLVALRVKRAVPSACGIFVIAPLAARLWLAPADAAFDAGMREVALFRLDAIAFGVAAAWFVEQAPALVRDARRTLLLMGLFLALVPGSALASLADEATFAAWRPFIFTFGSAGLALCLPAALGIDLRPGIFRSAVNWLSGRSYCLYVIHLSIIDLVWSAAGRFDLPRMFCTPAVLIVSAAIAELSWRYFEAPILHMRPAARRDEVRGAPLARPLDVGLRAAAWFGGGQPRKVS